MMVLNINTNAVVQATRKLEAMHRSVLPVAVRSTLNKAAFDVKQDTMPRSAYAHFEHRQANFFKANSKVTPATGFALSSMEATIGFVPFSGSNKAVDDLEQQEHGGGIGGRAFVPLKQARTGTSWNRNVKKSLRMGEIRSKIVDSRNAPGKNDAEKFTRSAIHAGKGGLVIGNRMIGKGNKVLFRIDSIKKVGRNTVVKSTPLFAVKGGRVVTPKATHFMEEAARNTGRKMDKFFMNAAEKQIQKLK